MGGRGADSGGRKYDEAAGASVARDLAASQNGKDLKEMYHWFNEDRKAFLQDAKNGIDRDGEFDTDHSYVLIDRFGESNVLSWASKPEEWKEVKAKDTVYIALQTGDGWNDSNGFNTMNPRHDAQRSSDNFREGYDNEIEYIYKTRWAQKHPRGK